VVDITSHARRSGEEELLGLGRRWAQRLPTLTSGPHDWVYTDTQRTRESARRFKEGMGLSTSLPPPEPNRRLLAFYNICAEYKRAIFKGKKTKKELTALFSSFELPGVKKMVGPINDRLGYRNKTLSSKSVKLMWDICRYEMSWFPEHQPLEKDYNSSSSAHKWPWCAVFTEKEMRIMEDNEDLFYYHQDGYQHNVTSAMTVELLKDLLESGEGDKDLPQGKFFFAHSETFLPLLVALGVAKDEPPLSVENMPADRKWRTSLIGGESSNLAMVVHKCKDSPLPQLQFFLNERPVEPAGCPKGLCTSAHFLNHHAIKGSVSQTFEEVCKPEKKGEGSPWPRD